MKNRSFLIKTAWILGWICLVLACLKWYFFPVIRSINIARREGTEWVSKLSDLNNESASVELPDDEERRFMQQQDVSWTRRVPALDQPASYLTHFNEWESYLLARARELKLKILPSQAAVELVPAARLVENHEWIPRLAPRGQVLSLSMTIEGPFLKVWSFLVELCSGGQVFLMEKIKIYRSRKVSRCDLDIKLFFQGPVQPKAEGEKIADDGFIDMSSDILNRRVNGPEKQEEKANRDPGSQMTDIFQESL